MYVNLIMNRNNFDLFVIGGGSGGVRAARIAASKGLKVGMAEGWDVGGTCVNRGCIPKKLYSYSSHFADDFKLMKSFGWSSGTIKFSWQKLVRNKKLELKRLKKIYTKLLVDSGVKIFSKYASFYDSNSLIIGKDKIFSKNIIIAVGTRPKRLDFNASSSIYTSDNIFDIKSLPKKMLILGGGYIAAEFASIFNGFGVETTISIRGNKILKDFDDEMSNFLMDEMQKKGIRFMKSNFPEDIKVKGKKMNVNFKKGNKELFDLVLEATGRVPNIEYLNLENCGVKVRKNSSVVIDNFFRTSKKNIYAIGDVIDRIQLTPVAIAEAMSVVHNLINKKKKKFDYNYVPTAVFTNPNYASVGMSEEVARKKFNNIKVFKSSFKSLRFSLSDYNDRVFIKLIVNSVDDRILGLHYIGENAAEIIQGFAVSILKGLKKKDFDNTIGIHPSCAEEIVTLKNYE